MSRLITAAMLRERAACEEQVAEFARLFPDGTPVTLAACRAAAEAGLDLGGAAGNLLSTPALANYRAATATARANYHAANATAFHAAWLIDHPAEATP